MVQTQCLCYQIGMTRDTDNRSKPPRRPGFKSGTKPDSRPARGFAGRSDRPNASQAKPGKAFAVKGDRDKDQKFRSQKSGSQKSWSQDSRSNDRPSGRSAKRGNRPAPHAPDKTSAHAVDGAQRIAKVMARAGLCSRRDAELWIEAGRVSVNGIVLESPAFNVKPDDKILVDGRRLAAAERTRLFLFHKPRGYVTTDRDPEGRPTIFEAMPEGLPRVVTIGRLDINTEGLLLLTNDGGLARLLELPSTGWLRRYRVRAKGTTDQAQLDALRNGITIYGIVYAGIEAKLDRVQGANVWLTMGLREGKNREIKRVLEFMGLEVNRLIRLSFGPFQLGEIAEGEVEEVPTRILKDQLGPALAAEAGVDFEGPSDQLEQTDSEHSHRIQKDRRDRNRDRKNDRIAQSKTEEVPRPRVDRPKPAQRKHVSVLRAERQEGAQKRQRVEVDQTQDRKGRSVRIERLSAVSDKPEKHTRNGRRFARQREAGEDQRAKGRTRGAERGARSAERGARSLAQRNERSGSANDRTQRSSERSPHSSERTPRRERSFDQERAPRSREGDFEARDFNKRGDRGQGAHGAGRASRSDALRSDSSRTDTGRGSSGRGGSDKRGRDQRGFDKGGFDKGGFDKGGKGSRPTGRPPRKPR